MTIFGDYEPEDAWDAGDTVDDKLTNLERRMNLVERDPSSPRSVSRLAGLVTDLRQLDTQGAKSTSQNRALRLKQQVERVRQRNTNVS